MTKTIKRFLFKWLLIGLLIFVGGTILYAVYLAKEVRIKFEGKRWELPAQVYAKPLELFVGAAISSQQFAAELKRIGYRQTPYPRHAGEWSQDQQHFLVATRQFKFSDGIEPQYSLDIRFKDQKISQLRDGNQSLSLIRLEPALIDSIHPLVHEDRILLNIKKTPKVLINGLIAVEDRKFYQHFGINPLAIIRAMVINIIKRKGVQGGSTLTQQLVKNFFLTPERSLKRKYTEAIMALILEAQYSKDDILETYMNEIFLGQDGNRAIHGFSLAALYYFDTPLNDLTIEQQATLIAMVKGASWFNPRKHPERVKKRRDLVLKVMLEQHVINQSDYKTALKKRLGIAKHGRFRMTQYPAFMQLVKRQLKRDYKAEDLNTEGLRIFTTLDPWLQDLAQESISNTLEKLEKQRDLPSQSLQGALVSVQPQTGNILTLVGDRKHPQSGFNRAIDAIRPIGSLIKPFVYLTALSSADKYHLYTLLDDSPLTVKLSKNKTWQPLNYDKKFRGEVPLLQALAQSLNVPTVRLGMAVGIDKIAQTIKDFGIKRPFDTYPSMLLGALALSPLEVAQLYQGLANGGFSSPLKSITSVTDNNGNELQRYPLTVKQSASDGAVYLINRALQTVVQSGTAKGLNQTFDADLGIAGKTGTTNDLKDSWFTGITGDQVTVVWLGRDDAQPAHLTGSSGALYVWRNYMQKAGVQALNLFPPESIKIVSIDPETGLIANHCTNKINIPFIQQHAPTVQADCGDHQPTKTPLNKKIKRFFSDFF